MILTNKQAIILYQIACGTYHIAGAYGGLNCEGRYKLVCDILNQQSDELIELGGLKDKDNEEKK